MTNLVQAMQEKKALSSRGRGRLRGFLELRCPWGFSHEARRGSQGASRAVPGNSCLHAHGEGELVITLFPHRVAFEEGSGPRVLLKSGPGNLGRSACGTTHVARLEFPREIGLILRCAGKAGSPFQTMQGNRLSCRDQEGRRGSEEAGPVKRNGKNNNNRNKKTVDSHAWTAVYPANIY